MLFRSPPQIFNICLTIQELPQFLKGVTKIQIKKIGEVSARSFKKVCMNRYKNNKKASSESVKLCAKWQKEILDSTWHPFKIVDVEGKEIQVYDTSWFLLCFLHVLV